MQGESEKGKQRVLSGAFKYSRAHPSIPDRRAHTAAGRVLARVVRARTHANSVLSKDWKPGEAPLHEILRAL